MVSSKLGNGKLADRVQKCSKQVCEWLKMPTLWEVLQCHQHWGPSCGGMPGEPEGLETMGSKSEVLPVAPNWQNPVVLLA